MSFNLHTDYNGKITKKDLKKYFGVQFQWNIHGTMNVWIT